LLSVLDHLGLLVQKNALEQGHKVDVYEKGAALGGTWVYTDETGKDEYGVNIHSAMYEELRTNSPYQVMEYPDHHFPNGTKSYPRQKDVLDYLNSYADRFDLKKHIRFHHLVEEVVSLKDDKWKVTVRDMQNKKTKSEVYDVVFVCIKIYSSPNYPQIEGASEFKGKIMHSHDYRKAEAFHGENVLVIGGGPSGIDLVIHLANTVNQITLSICDQTAFGYESLRDEFGDIVSLEKEVTRLTPNGAKFEDGSQQDFSVIIYATVKISYEVHMGPWSPQRTEIGYNYVYPFLGADTGIRVEDNYVQSLYKQIINIEHPTMAFVGLPTFAVNNRMFDLQARLALKFISGAKPLPSKADMLKDTKKYVESLRRKGISQRKLHVILPDDQKQYWRGIEETADIQSFPESLLDMFTEALNCLVNDPVGFRKNKYTIIDDKTFVKEREEKKPIEKGLESE
ncbi:senecionine N-oxygenase-like, partial [Sitodiplosis mosellana]|uniref:senecionine N-oxygenase-like n=1 Tax=Sitodiplosis mosellana TaxID=263140 RepID=UPI0024447DB7